MDKKLLDILVCPLTRQPLSLAKGDILDALNQAIGGEGLKFGEHVQREPLREALITRDGQRIYRVDDGIPVLLPEEAVETASVPGLAA